MGVVTPVLEPINIDAGSYLIKTPNPISERPPQGGLSICVDHAAAGLVASTSRGSSRCTIFGRS